MTKTPHGCEVTGPPQNPHHASSLSALFTVNQGTREVALWERALAPECGLSRIPGTSTRTRREPTPTGCPLTSTFAPWDTLTHTHTRDKCVNFVVVVVKTGHVGF